MENKKSFILMTVTLALVAVLLVFVFITGTVRPGSVQALSSGTAENNDSVEVYGQGKVSIDPDIAYITLGYQNTDKDPKKAQDDNAAKMDVISSAVKNSGVSDTDMQTSDYSVGQDYYNDKTTQDFNVTHMVKITVRNIKNAGSIIKAAYDAGANRFYGIYFDIENRQGAYLQALDMAMSRAEEKAKKLASDSGRSIGAVISVQESQSSSSPYYYPYSQLSNYVSEQAASNSAGSSGSISSGQLEITAVVTVTYKLN
jgi:uncharacterized protein